MANLIILPISDTFTSCLIVGTSTTPTPAFLQFSIAFNFVLRSFLPLNFIYTSSLKPSNCKNTVFNPALANFLI